MKTWLWNWLGALIIGIIVLFLLMAYSPNFNGASTLVGSGLVYTSTTFGKAVGWG